MKSKTELEKKAPTFQTKWVEFLNTISFSHFSGYTERKQNGMYYTFDNVVWDK